MGESSIGGGCGLSGAGVFTSAGQAVPGPVNVQAPMANTGHHPLMHHSHPQHPVISGVPFQSLQHFAPPQNGQGVNASTSAPYPQYQSYANMAPNHMTSYQASLMQSSPSSPLHVTGSVATNYRTNGVTNGVTTPKSVDIINHNLAEFDYLLDAFVNQQHSHQRKAHIISQLRQTLRANSAVLKPQPHPKRRIP
jgi:hypothetical protein